jgi:hypothetical protein
MGFRCDFMTPLHDLRSFPQAARPEGQRPMFDEDGNQLIVPSTPILINVQP